MQKVILNPSLGGSETGSINGSLIEKNYNLEIARRIFNNLTSNNINAYLIRDTDINLTNEERLNIINSLINEGDNVILLTTMLSSGNDSGSEVIYALRDTDDLARQISNEIEKTGINVLKYYQLRDPNDTSKNYYEIIEEPDNTESLIISFGYVDNSFDNSFLLNNQEKLADAVSDALINYIKNENVYVVKSGDSLYSIALKFNITVTRLKEANNLTTNNLSIGQELLIPESEEEKEPPKEEGFLNYTVKQGDSLYSIARNYNTTVNVIKEINNLTSNTLSIGQILKIPTTNNNGNNDANNYTNYTVKRGDSLYQIAIKFNTTVNDIKSLNNLTTNNLSIGQVLKIPTNNNSNNTNNYINYTVKSADSLYQIAIKFNTTVNNIKNLNNLTTNNLSVGQVLKIPTTNNNNNNNNISNYINYTVKSGDSLYQIAKTYNTTVNDIKNLNNLTSNNLSIGQVLKIPTK